MHDFFFEVITVITLSIGTDKSEQIMKTQIRCHRVQYLLVDSHVVR